jgi:mRNA interferase HigB
VNVIAFRALRDFYARHPPAQKAMIAWHKDVSAARWRNWAELKADYGSADAVGDDRVVFDIGGNKYRIVARVAYAPYFRVMIKFVGTHAEYDRIDARSV